VFAAMTPDPALPCRLPDLVPADHALLLALRAVVTGQDDSPVLAARLERLWGTDAAARLRQIRVLVGQIALRGRRDVRIAPLGVIGLTRDEQQLLATLAAARLDRPDLLTARLRFLLGREPDAVVAASLREVGGAPDARAPRAPATPRPAGARA
jgi:hypothetical protein